MRPIVLVCPHCELPATADVRGSVEWSGYMPDRSDPVGPPEEYRLLQCQVCGQPILQGRQDFGDGDEEFTVVYPAQRHLSMAIPEPLRDEWREAEACFRAKAYTACAVMVRRVTEGVCSENGVDARTLVTGVRQMRDRGIIDGTLADWADALRVLGNRGAHYTGTPIARQDAEDALAFAEALLDHMYVLKRKFASMQRRLQDRPPKS